MRSIQRGRRFWGPPIDLSSPRADAAVGLLGRHSSTSKDRARTVNAQGRCTDQQCQCRGAKTAPYGCRAKPAAHANRLSRRMGDDRPSGAVAPEPLTKEDPMTRKDRELASNLLELAEQANRLADDLPHLDHGQILDRMESLSAGITRTLKWLGEAAV